MRVILNNARSALMMGKVWNNVSLIFKLLLTMSVLVLGLMGSASAQNSYTPGFYVAGHLGGSGLQGFNSLIRGNRIDSGFKLGYAATLAGGYRFGENLRMELETSYRRNTLSSFQVNGIDSPGIDGDVISWAGMVNVYFEIGDGPMRPYAGAGLGFVNTTIKDIKADFNIAGVKKLTGHNTVLGYQLMAGLSYEINPKISLTGEYRFLGNEAVGASGLEKKVRLLNHGMQVGARYGF